MGKTFQSELVRIKHMKELIIVTDLTNAGKRGKQVEEMHVTLTYAFQGDRDAWFDDLADQMVNLAGRGYEAVRAFALHLKNDLPGQVSVDFDRVKAINVEPYGEIFKFEIAQPKGAYIRVKSSPHDFSVMDHAYLPHPTKPGQGGIFQDTLYWPDKKKDAALFYGWMRDNHERARRFMNMAMFRKLWSTLGVTYDSH